MEGLALCADIHVSNRAVAGSKLHLQYTHATEAKELQMKESHWLSCMHLAKAPAK
jgi:hypothetical protein